MARELERRIRLPDPGKDDKWKMEVTEALYKYTLALSDVIKRLNERLDDLESP
jgi:hypothetical protein